MSNISVLSVSSNTSLSYNDGYDVILIDATSGNISINLPQIDNDGMKYELKRIDNSGNSVSLVAYSGDAVETASISALGSKKLVSMLTPHKWHSLY